MNRISITRSAKIRLIIGLILVIILIYFLNPSQIITTLLSVNFFYLILAILVYALTLFVLSYRWKKNLIDMGIRLSYMEAYSAFVGGVLLSDVTPGRIGELSRPLLIGKDNQGSKSIISVILDRFIDIITIIPLGLIGILFFIPGEKGKLLWALSIPVCVIVVIIILWHSNISLEKIIARMGFTGITNITQKCSNAFASITSPKKLVFRSVFLTIIAWCGHAIRLTIIAAALGYSLQSFYLVFILPLISVLSLVPVTISGLGLVEGGLALVLSDMGIPLSAGLAIAFLDRAVTVFFHIVVGLPAMKKIVQI